MNSHNHPALSSVGAWMYRWLAGIRLGGYGTGYADVVFGPGVVDNPALSSLNASLRSTLGTVAIHWRFDVTTRTLEIVISLPANARGRLIVPRVRGVSGAWQPAKSVEMREIDEEAHGTLSRVHAVWPVSPGSAPCVGAVCAVVRRSTDMPAKCCTSEAEEGVQLVLHGGGTRQFMAHF
jgi:hypothetical protein